MPLGTNRVNNWIKGELASFTDLNAENETMFTFAAAFAAFLLGKNSVNSAASDTYHQPLSLTVNPPYGVTIGGPNQICVINGRLADEIAATALSVSPNTATIVRSDIIVAMPTENSVAPFSRSVRNPDTSITATTVYQRAQSLLFQVIPGTGGLGNLGVVPTGYAQVAEIDVPPSSAPLVTASAYITLPSFASVLAALAVTSLNGLVGPIALQCPDGSINITPGLGVILLQAAAAAAALSSLNGLSGAVNLESTDGSIIVTPTGQAINLRQAAAAAVTSLHGLAGVLDLESTDGSIIINSSPAQGLINLRQASTAVVGPVGSTYVNFVRITAAGRGSVALSQLPGPASWLYRIKAQAVLDIISGTATIAGAGSGVNWYGGATSLAQDGNGTEILQLIGSAGGGLTPSVSIAPSNPNLVGNDYIGILEIWAVRVA